jgi:ribosomal protein L16 Arg81 hydroxylase
MTQQPFDLGKLLAPLGCDEFFASYWERRHFLLRREQPRYYEPLITSADLENIISQPDARYPAIRLAKGGHYFAPEVYTRNIKQGDESFLGVPDLKRISDEYRRGATVVLPALHRTWPALTVLCDALQTQLDHPAHANVYITPGYAAGFTPHYDTHEVFVLQVAGEKRWSVYAPTIELPHRSQVFTPQAYAGQAPIAEFELEAGDLLYLPRGWLHSTTTSRSFSAHVTIGITVYTRADLLLELLQTAVADPAQRKALAPGFASDAEIRKSLTREMRDALERLHGAADLDQLVGSFTARVRASRAPRPAAFKADAVAITLDSAFSPPAPGTYALINDEGKTQLEFAGVRYPVLAPVALAIRALCALSVFCGEDLKGHLDAEGRLTLIRHLHDIGFLTRLE